MTGFIAIDVIGFLLLYLLYSLLVTLIGIIPRNLRPIVRSVKEVISRMVNDKSSFVYKAANVLSLATIPKDLAGCRSFNCQQNRAFRQIDHRKPSAFIHPVSYTVSFAQLSGFADDFIWCLKSRRKRANN